MTMTEKAKTIRAELKKELGLNNKHVSVRKNSCSIRVYIKSEEAYKVIDKIEKIAEKQESYQRDEATGEILCGGNTFVFTEIDYDWRKSIEAKFEKEVDTFIELLKTNSNYSQKLNNEKFVYFKDTDQFCKTGNNNHSNEWFNECSAKRILSLAMI